MASEAQFPNPCIVHQSSVPLVENFDLLTFSCLYAKEVNLDNTDFVQFQICCLNGECLSKLVPKARVASFLKNGLNCITFASVFGVGGTISPTLEFGAGQTGYSDGFIYGDVSTFIPCLPWSKGKVGRIICEPYQNGAPLPSWRYNCRRLLSELKDMGLEFYGALEYEFTAYHQNTGEPVTKGLEIFNTIRNNFDEELRIDSANMLKQVGIQINTMNGEYAPGQIEWTMTPTWGIEVADQGFDFRNGIKQIFQNRGYNATFMTRVDPGAGGCNNGGHFNFSLWNDTHDLCAFWDAKNKCLSKLGQYALGGLLKNASAIVGLCAATPVDYARLKAPHNFAPSNASWGFENRTCFVRVKTYDNKRCYFEVRSPSAMSNPYIVQSAVIAACIDGIRNEIVPPPPVTGDASDLTDIPVIPYSVAEGTKAIEENKAMRDLFSTPFDELAKAHLLDLFVDVKRAEAAVLTNEEGEIDWVKMKELCFLSI